MTGSANVGFELKCARDFMDHIFITSEHREGERAHVHRQQRLFRCTSGVLKWDLMSFAQQHEDNGVWGSTRQWLVQDWLYADFCKKARLQESSVQTFTSFYWGGFYLLNMLLAIIWALARFWLNPPVCQDLYFCEKE